MLRKSGAPKISSKTAINGISCIKYRGSSLGAGYAAFNTDVASESGGSHAAERTPYRIQAFINGDQVAEQIQSTLEDRVGLVHDSRIRRIGHGEQFAVWEASLLARNPNSDALLEG